MDAHSSLFCRNVSDEGKKFYNTDTSAPLSTSKKMWVLKLLTSVDQLLYKMFVINKHFAIVHLFYMQRPGAI